ncbi:hypothetical protein KP509_24G053600 [Ceratopteris richardii]|nr:hypothetical protein KP509_24G053600 [Ceratopteris richardii]
MGTVERSPLMIAALFGSMDALIYLLSLPAEHGVDVNRIGGEDKACALLCALTSATSNVGEMVQLLLRRGADPSLVPHQWRLAIPSKHASLCLLFPQGVEDKPEGTNGRVSLWEGILPDSVSDISLEDLEEMMGQPTQDAGAESSFGPSLPSPWSPKSMSSNSSLSANSEPQLEALASDAKNSMYSTDEFRMYSFKVRPCSRAYSHDWTECPFAHPGENARRRDPRRFHYSCVPCPDFRKGTCRHGDACEYAHGVFESWLHPAQYRTRLCKDGRNCTRKVCFFAHSEEEVRPLYISAEALSPCASPTLKSPSFGGLNLLPSSPTSEIPAGNSWAQSGLLPSLCLPEGISHRNRLRASLSARNIVVDSQPRDLFSLSAQARINAAVVASAISNPAASSPTKEAKRPSFKTNMMCSSISDEVLCSAVSPRSPLQMSMHSSPRGALNLRERNLLSLQDRNLANASMEELILHEQKMGNPSLEELFAAMSYTRLPYDCRSPQGRHEMDKGQPYVSLPSPHAPSLASLSPRSNGASPVQSMHLPMGLLHQRSMGGSPACLPAAENDWASPTGKLEWSVSGEVLTHLRKSNSCKA